MVLNTFLILTISYLLGAIPFGYIIVWLMNKKDVRTVESGRIGGTNAMRAAGWLAGVLTAIFDIAKGASTGLVVQWLAPGNVWLIVFAALMAIIGHNYSIFMIIKTEGKIRLGGGAGGATTFGGAIALYPSAALVILPLVVLVYLFVGYASVTTMSIAFLSLLFFGYMTLQGILPWQFILYGVFALIIVVYALRPNIKRLINGTERLTGLRLLIMKKHTNPVPRAK